jgi:hypothetical protein
VNPVGSTPTASEPGAEPWAGVTESQLPPEVVLAVARNWIAAPLLWTWTTCGLGVLPPAGTFHWMPGRDAARNSEAPTLRITWRDAT